MSRRRYCDAATRGIGPTSATLVLPADDPPAGPSVKSQTLPADSATNDQGPAAACACGSAAKFSMRQKSGPAGNSSTFFSASGFATSDCWAIAVGCNGHNPDQDNDQIDENPSHTDTSFVYHPPDSKRVYPISKWHQRVSESRHVFLLKARASCDAGKRTNEKRLYVALFHGQRGVEISAARLVRLRVIWAEAAPPAKPAPRSRSLPKKHAFPGHERREKSAAVRPLHWSFGIAGSANLSGLQGAYARLPNSKVSPL